MSSSTTDAPKKTIIELTALENANSKLPPSVIGTVYQARAFVNEHQSGAAVNPSDNDDSDDENDFGSMNGAEESIRTPSLDLMLSVDEYLKNRAAAILQKNPWLASKIVPSPKAGSGFMARIKNMTVKAKNLNLVGQLAIEFPTEFSEEEARDHVRKVVRVVTTVAAGTKLADSTTSRELVASYSPSAMNIIIADPLGNNSYSEIIDAIRPCLHASTESVVGSNQTLWDILVIPLTEASTSLWNNKFLLVHSLDRSLADATTLYKIYNMLGADKPIEALDPTRNSRIDTLRAATLGEDPNILRSQPVLKGLTKRLVRAGLGLNPSLNPDIGLNATTMWTVDEDKLRAIRDKHKANHREYDYDNDEPLVPEISNDDILTSWFLHQNKDAALGCLVMDMRGKHPEIDEKLAGNFDVEIVYNTPYDVKTPAWIRASLSRKDGFWKRATDRDFPPPSVLSGGWSKGAPGATIVNNWSSLYESVVLIQKGGIELFPEVHIPIYLQHRGVVNEHPVGWNTLIIFRYSEKKLGLLVMAPSSATDGEEAPVERPAIIKPYSRE